MGRQLYRFVKDAELSEIDIDPILFYSTSLEEVRELARVYPWLDRMKEAGLVSEREIKDWLDRLDQADETGRFFASLVAFTVAGTVPE